LNGPKTPGSGKLIAKMVTRWRGGVKSVISKTDAPATNSCLAGPTGVNGLVVVKECCLLSIVLASFCLQNSLRGTRDKCVRLRPGKQHILAFSLIRWLLSTVRANYNKP